jgi:hypothetical protein
MKEDAPTTPLTGALTVAEIVKDNPLKLVTLGKTNIADLGARLRQIAHLKPGGVSIRTDEMIAALLDRLMCGETLTSILTDPSMPGVSTFWGWCKRDADLDRDVKEAQAIGQRVLADLRLNIAQGGEFSTGDPRRDELVIKTIWGETANRHCRYQLCDAWRRGHVLLIVRKGMP